MFDIELYDYHLPPELIAQRPSDRRDHSRLLVLDRQKGVRQDCFFFQLPQLLERGDLIVVNDTKVVPARLFGRKETGGRVEILVLYNSSEIRDDYTRPCLIKSSKRPKPGTRLVFDDGVRGIVEGLSDDGSVCIRFEGIDDLDAFLDKRGTVPLPPYIKRSKEDPLASLDRERYQTVFSRKRGAVAAPTASLHFTEELVSSLKDTGISIVTLTLHVGHGTFRPVRVKDIRMHEVGKEYFHVPRDTADAINAVKTRGGRIVAVGTTVVRTLETVVNHRGKVVPGKGVTDLLITPGFKFKVVDALVTNFHLPKSSLLFLVSAFAGRKTVLDAYRYAVSRSYRFYSYGDAMLIV